LLNELDQTLAALLKGELPGQITVSFAAPDDKFSVRLPAVDLFLYDVRENLELRSNDDVFERQGDFKSVRFQPPVRVDASYLITAWPGVGSGQGDTSEDEHKLLGAVMRALLRYPKLPREFLKGSLASQALPLPVSTLQPGRLQSLGEFWQALGGKPKAALNYTVTLPIDVSKPETYPLVVDHEVRIRLDTKAAR
jgi:Pvc16 N-terminal domain